MQRANHKSSKKTDNETTKSPPRTGKQLNRKIEDEIRQHLDNHEEIDTSAVEVAVTGGDIELKGEVDNPHAKSLTRSITELEVPTAKKVKVDKLKIRRDNTEAP